MASAEHIKEDDDNWLIECMYGMGHDLGINPDVIYDGVALLGTTAILAKDISTFQQRWSKSHDHLYPILQATISTALQELSITSNDPFEKIVTSLEPEKKHKLIDEIHRNVVANIEHTARTSKINLPEIQSFFYSIRQYTKNWMNYLYPGMQPQRQTMPFVPITIPEGLYDDIALIDKFSGLYTQDELAIYFQSLQDTFYSSENDIALLLIGSTYSIAVGLITTENSYTKIKTKSWLLINPKHVAVEIIDRENVIGEKIFSAFSDNGFALIETKIYSRKIVALSSRKTLLDWHTISTWRKLHAVIPNKVKYINSEKYSWLDFATISDQRNIVELLLKLGADLHEIDSAPLLLPSRLGYREIVKTLLRNGADPNKADQDGCTSLVAAVYGAHPDTVRILLENGANPNTAIASSLTPIIFAAKYGHVVITKYLLKNGADPNKATNQGTTPLMVAAQSGRATIIKILLMHGADPHRMNNNGETALLIAARCGQSDIVKIFLTDYFSSQQSTLPFKPLTTSQCWFLRIIQGMFHNEELIGLCFGIALIGVKEILNADFYTFQQRWLKIHYVLYPLTLLAAVETQQMLGKNPYETFEHIFENLKDDGKKIFFNHLRKRINYHLNSLNIPSHFEIDSIKNFFHTALEHQELGTFYLSDFDMKLHDKFWSTKLFNEHSAFKKLEINPYDIVIAKTFTGIYTKEELFDYFHSLRNALGHVNASTAFILVSFNHAIVIGYEANENNYLQSTWIFIDANFLPGEKIEQDELLAKKVFSSFLMEESKESIAFLTHVYAKQEYAEDIRRKLSNLKHYYSWKKIHSVTPFKAKLLDARGASWLFTSIRAREVELTQLLLANGADPSLSIPEHDETPISFAIKEDQEDIVEMLLEHGADPNQTCSYNNKPIFLAIERNNIDITKNLLDKYANPNQVLANGNTVLTFAIKQENINIVNMLLNYGADVHQTASFDLGHGKVTITPLTLATTKGNADIVNSLLNKHADPNKSDEDGTTPLFIAAKMGYVEIVKILLNNKADPNLRSRNNYTPLYIAVQNGHAEIVELLLDYGAALTNEKPGR